MFEDRKDAGNKLARALKEYENKNILVLAIPKGGVEVGYQVARKLPFPDNPEAGFGAIAEDGSAFIFEDAARTLSEEQIKQIKEKQQEVIEVMKKVK